MNPVYDNVSVSVDVGRVLDAIDKFSDGLDEKSKRYSGAEAKEVSAADRVQDVLQQSNQSQFEEGNSSGCENTVQGERVLTRCDNLFGAETNCELVETTALDSDCLHRNTMSVCDTMGVRDDDVAGDVLDGSRADLVNSSDVRKVGEENADDNYVSFHHFASAIVHKALDEAMRRNANSKLEASAEHCEMKKSVEINSSGALADRPTKIDTIETPATQLLASSSEGDCIISDSLSWINLWSMKYPERGLMKRRKLKNVLNWGRMSGWVEQQTSINLKLWTILLVMTNMLTLKVQLTLWILVTLMLTLLAHLTRQIIARSVRIQAMFTQVQAMMMLWMRTWLMFETITGMMVIVCLMMHVMDVTMVVTDVRMSGVDVIPSR